MRYFTSEKACWTLVSLSPSKSLNSPLVGRLRREWRVWPSMLKAATPVGARTTTWCCRRSQTQWMRYNFSVPAVPEKIILRGEGLLAECCWTVVYTCSWFPSRLAGLVVVVNTSGPAACLCWERMDGASSMFGYDCAYEIQSMSSCVSMLGCISAFWRQIGIHSSVACN